VTSHSPDLLDNDQIDPHSLFAVEFREGASAIAPVDQVGIRAVRESLYTPGELLRAQSTRPRPGKPPANAENDPRGPVPFLTSMSPAKLILSTIVEGDGEVVAFPILLRRIAAWLSPGLVVEVPRPFQVKRDRFVNKADQRNEPSGLPASGERRKTPPSWFSSMPIRTVRPSWDHVCCKRSSPSVPTIGTR